MNAITYMLADLHIKVFPLIGIVILFGALIWANYVLVAKWPTVRNIVMVLLVLLGICLILYSLGIFPEGSGISVRG